MPVSSLRRPKRAPSRAGRTHVIRAIGNLNGDAAVVVGTTRLVDIGALVESVIQQDINGTTFRRFTLVANVLPTVVGAQAFGHAVFRGSIALDAADVGPLSAPNNFAWYARRMRQHRGSAHQLTAANEFDPFYSVLRFSSRKLGWAAGETLWYAEEVTGQTQNSQSHFDVSVVLG